MTHNYGRAGGPVPPSDRLNTQHPHGPFYAAHERVFPVGEELGRFQLYELDVQRKIVEPGRRFYRTGDGVFKRTLTLLETNLDILEQSAQDLLPRETLDEPNLVAIGSKVKRTEAVAA